MSAECGKCGTDIVYPAGTWPVGECPVCDMRVTDEMIKRGARAYYMADKEVTEVGWEDALSMARDEYLLAARIVLTAALSTKETHNERSA